VDDLHGIINEPIIRPLGLQEPSIEDLDIIPGVGIVSEDEIPANPV